MRDINTKKTAVCGVYLALTIVMLFAASVVPGIELTILAVTSAIAAFIIIETGIKFGMGFYVAACLLGFLIIPNKLGILPYVMFFGIYPIIKYFAEKNPKPIIQIIIKFSFFVVILLIAYFLLFDIFFGSIKLPMGFPVILIIPAAIIMFILLDYILTIIINIYFRKIHSKL